MIWFKCKSNKMTQFIKMYDTIFSNFKYKNDTIYKNVCHKKYIIIIYDYF